MSLPAVGSTVKILRTGELGLVMGHKPDGEWMDISVARLPVGSFAVPNMIYLLKEGDFEIRDNAEVQPPKYHVGQNVTVDINGRPWTGRVAMVPNGDRYVVDLLVEFQEDELTPFVITKPGH